jgi:phosphoribosylformylglycinamidine synthase
VQNSLLNLGMNLENIRQGKYFELEINEKDQVKAEKKIDDMCKKLLVNLIIEDYKVNKL